MKICKVLGFIVLAIGLMMCRDVSTEAANVYKVNKQGELYQYKGSSEVRIRSNTSAIRPGAFEGVKTKRFSVSGGSYFKAVDGVLYSKDGNVLVKYPTEKSGAFAIPSTVTKIADGAFQNCTKLTKVNIPPSVTSMGKSCFKGATSLQVVCTGAGLKKLPDHSFEGCRKLTKIEIPKLLEEIGKGCFMGCTSLREIRCPDALRVIEDETFYACVNLTRVTNTEQLEKIGRQAFAQCMALSGFVFGENLNTIEEQAFVSCESLGEVKIPKGLTRICGDAFVNSAGGYVVDKDNPNYASQDGLLMNESKTKLIQAPSQSCGVLNIPESVKEIGYSALMKTKYSSITIPEGVTEINILMFNYCKNLKSIVLPSTLDKVNQVRDYSYEDVEIPNLEQVLISDSNATYRSEDGVLYTKDGAEMIFFPSGRKGSFHLPDSCKKIGLQMVLNELSEIRVSANHKYYRAQDGVLYDLKGKRICGYPMNKAEYVIPKKVTNIDYLFHVKKYMNCNTVRVEKGNPKFSGRDGVVFSKDGRKLLFYPTQKKGKYIVPKKVKKIQEYAFSNAKKLTSVTISENVSNGGTRFYFDNCDNLKEVKVKDGNLNYFRTSFYHCYKVKKVSIPSNVMTASMWFLPEGTTVYGWDNDATRGCVEDDGGRYVSRGKVPKAVSGCRVKKKLDKYQVRWNASRGVDGYQIFTQNGTVETLSGSGKTSCLLDDSYVRKDVYVRAYRVVKGKKIYGKAKYVYME